MKKIPLNLGMEAIVDDEYYEPLLAIGGKWYVLKHGATFYARANIRLSEGQRQLTMHQMLMYPKVQGKEIDHINRNGLDNRLSNLRWVTHAENMRNRRVGPSGFYGVHRCVYSTGTIHWVASIWIGNLQIKVHVGTFKTAIEAALAYDAKCIELGMVDRLNFPTPSNTVRTDLGQAAANEDNVDVAPSG